MKKPFIFATAIACCLLVSSCSSNSTKKDVSTAQETEVIVDAIQTVEEEECTETNDLNAAIKDVKDAQTQALKEVQKAQKEALEEMGDAYNKALEEVNDAYQKELQDAYDALEGMW